MKIYHNPRCRKSREGLELLKNSGQDFEIVEYLKTRLSSDEIKSLLEKLNLEAEGLVRKGEAIWKENFKGKDLSDQEIIEAMATHPKLIERPIVEKGNKAVLGRPPENIKTLL